MKKLLGISAAVIGLAAFAGAAQAQTVIYQDNFGAGNTTNSGLLAGTHPDVADANNNTWLVGPPYTDPNSLGYYDGTVSIAPGLQNNGDSVAYLPVNLSPAQLGYSGTYPNQTLNSPVPQGPYLNGTVGFTLSAQVTPGAEGTEVFLDLFNGQPNPNYANSAYFGTLANVGVLSGFTTYYSPGLGYQSYDFGLGGAGGVTLTLNYTPGNTTTDGTLSYLVGSTVVYTESDITQTEIAGITGVGFSFYNNSSADPTATVEGFKLTEAAVPEPSTVWLFALGIAGLVFQIQRKRLSKV